MMGLKDYEIDCYLKSGRIARDTLKYAIDLIGGSRRINLYNLCISIEKYIRDKGGIPAFPCNISLNEIAAHYSPTDPDDTIIFDEGLLKIDVGVMIDGYIADTAITIARGYKYEDIAKANKQILEEAIKLFRDGVKLGEIGEYIENRAIELGYKPISNLTGHLISRYNLHAGKNVPNVKQIFSPRIAKGEVYAIEPFLTFANNIGYVISGIKVQIFSLTKTKKIKDEDLDKFKNYILENFKTLPFSPRWLYDIYGFEETWKLINRLRKLKYLRDYPILVEKSGGYVSQFEHTVIIADQPIVTTL